MAVDRSALDQQNLLDAQASVLGSMLIDSRCVGAVLAEVRPDYITQPTYRMIFDAITHLYADNRKIDAVTVLAEVTGGGKNTAMYDLVARLMQVTPTAANVGEYVRILKQRARLMSLKDLASEILGAESEDDIAQLLDRANAIMVSRPGVRTATMAEAYQEFFARHDPDVKKEYLRWGIQELDDAIYAGPGDMVVIGGYPSDGKTTFALSTAFRMAGKKKVGFFSYETDKDKLYDRIVASVAQIGLAKLKLNALNANDWDTMAAIGKQLAEPKLQLIEASGMTVQDIRSWALSRHFDLIVVDYLQKIKPVRSTRYASDCENVSQISSDLQQLGRQTGIPIIALSQLSRPERNKSGKIPPPTLSSLRSSGQIEQDADVVMLLYREDQDSPNSRRLLRVAKNKEGESNIGVKLDFDGQTQTFRRSSSQPQHGSLPQPQRPRYQQASMKPGEFGPIDIPDSEIPF